MLADAERVNHDIGGEVGSPAVGGWQCSQPASPSGFGYGRTDPGFFRDGRAGLWETGFPKKSRARPG